jgi:hypothetical protein
MPGQIGQTWPYSFPLTNSKIVVYSGSFIPQSPRKPSVAPCVPCLPPTFSTFAQSYRFPASRIPRFPEPEIPPKTRQEFPRESLTVRLKQKTGAIFQVPVSFAASLWGHTDHAALLMLTRWAYLTDSLLSPARNFYFSPLAHSGAFQGRLVKGVPRPRFRPITMPSTKNPRMFRELVQRGQPAGLWDCGGLGV